MRHTFILKYLIIIISFFMIGNLKAQTIEVEVNENVGLMVIFILTLNPSIHKSSDSSMNM